MRITVGLTVFAIATMLGNAPAQSVRGRPSLVHVENLQFKDRALNILVALAERYKVVIGVSGALVGADRQVVNISVADGNLKEVLDSIAKQDPRFEWNENVDNSIYVRVKNAPLSLSQARVSSVNIENPGRLEFVHQLSQVPEVASWLQQNDCLMDELISGPAPRSWGQFSVQLNNVPVSDVLDEIASKSQTYFWSIIKYHDEPCYINVRP